MGAFCIGWLRREAGIVGGITFADPGRGHLGICYQSLAFTYLGLGRAETAYVWKDGNGHEGLPRRAIGKALAKERGWRGTARRLVAHGAPEPPLEPRAYRAWVDEWVARLTRRECAKPKYRYAFARTRRARKDLARQIPDPPPYPKLVPTAAYLERGAGA